MKKFVLELLLTALAVIMPLTAQNGSKLGDILNEGLADIEALQWEFESRQSEKPSDEALKFAKSYENKRISNDTRALVNIWDETIYYGKFIVNIYGPEIYIDVAAKNIEDAEKILKTYCPPNANIPEDVFFGIYCTDGTEVTRSRLGDYITEY